MALLNRRRKEKREKTEANSEQVEQHKSLLNKSRQETLGSQGLGSKYGERLGASGIGLRVAGRLSEQNRLSFGLGV